MSDPIQNLLGLGAIKVNPFPPNSRYNNIQTATLETPDGNVTIYLRRRWVPSPNGLPCFGVRRYRGRPSR
jgi:hypothetical protein